MEIRKINISELKSSLQLVEDVFMEFEAPEYSKEGVDNFFKFTNYENVLALLQQGKLQMLVCFCEKQVIGVIATRELSHICLLFVKKQFHRQGIATNLMNRVKELYQNEVFTVNSSPYAIEFYHAMGFKDIDKEQLVDGIRFTPMRYDTQN